MKIIWAFFWYQNRHFHRVKFLCFLFYYFFLIWSSTIMTGGKDTITRKNIIFCLRKNMIFTSFRLWWYQLPDYDWKKKPHTISITVTLHYVMLMLPGSNKNINFCLCIFHYRLMSRRVLTLNFDSRNNDIMGSLIDMRINLSCSVTAWLCNIRVWIHRNIHYGQQTELVFRSLWS